MPNERVGIRLEYAEPFKMTQHSAYIVKSAGGQSVVTWKVTGKNNFFGRLMRLFLNMDKTVGGLFEKGLSKLKTIVEKS